MEYLYSSVVDTGCYDPEGLCNGIPLRVHKYADLEDIGAIRAHEDWRKYVGPVEEYHGGLGPRFSFITVSIPECLPERLEVISYATEFAFMQDDITDVSTQDVNDKENTDTMVTFKRISMMGSAELEEAGKKRIQAQILLKMMAIDYERAITTAKSWAKFVQTAAGKEHHKNFKTLDEYLLYRSIDVGQMFWHGMFTFAMSLTIPEEEMPLCEKLIEQGWHVASLQNDLFSYDKEYRDTVQHGQTDVVNAVWVLMKEHNVTVDEAKQICRTQIKEMVAKYLGVVEETRNDGSISLDLRKYVESMQYALSGNVAWSRECPRYNEKATYNDLQLKRMKYGVGKYPATLAMMK